MEKVLFNEFYDQYYRKSFLFVRSYVHDVMAAEDIVAESLVKLWRCSSENPVENPIALLLTILKNKSLDHLKHEIIHESAIKNLTEMYQRELDFRISTLEAFNSDEICSSEIHTVLEKTLSSLPEQTRRIFEMSRFENLSVKEISQQTNMSVKGVEYHITKALKVLRVELKDYLYLLYFILN